MSAKTDLAMRLRMAAPHLAGKRVVAGFDGFVDSIVKVVKQKGYNTGTTYFQSIQEFGQYIVGKKGAGFSLETEELFQKAGGNMPIMAGALAELGVPVDCIGAMGAPHLHPVFAAMHPRCHPLSFADPGFTTAMEFSDGKFFLGQMKALNLADWSFIKKAIGLDTIIECYQRSDLVCLVNWSEIDASNDIWAGILRDVIPALGPGQRERQFFFDLSDCSKRSPGTIREALGLLKEFSRAGQVILSLNRNEAKVLYRALPESGEAQAKTGQVGEDDHCADLEFLGTALCKLLPADMLVIHTSGISLAWHKGSIYTSKPLFIPAPILSTGAGDHFNAGFCSGLLMGLDPGLSLLLANTAAGFYMQNGRSPDIEALMVTIC